MKHIQQDYKSKAVGGEIYDESNLNKHEEDSEDAIALSTINLFGMDEEDLARIDQKKVDGTLQVNSGVIKFGENTFADSNLVINGGNISIDNYEYEPYNIYNLNVESEFSVVIDLNVNTKETDAFYVGEKV